MFQPLVVVIDIITLLKRMTTILHQSLFTRNRMSTDVGCPFCSKVFIARFFDPVINDPLDKLGLGFSGFRCFAL